MIDSHTHLHVCKPDDAELVAAATQAGVKRMLTVGTNADDLPRGAARPPSASRRCWPRSVAIPTRPRASTTPTSPTCTSSRDIRAASRSARPGWTTSATTPRATISCARFIGQIELARATGKPLVIHTRAAEDDTIDVLREHAAGLDVILHCFTMAARLDECLEQGWWISFAGNVTYGSALDLAEAAERVPDDRLLVETDAPYLTPQVVRKQRNQPAFVVHTARFVAERRGIDYEQLERIVERNAAGLFGW